MAALLAGLTLAPGAFAQTSDCAALLGAAHDAYVDRAFADAEALARRCLDTPETEAEAALRAYRLLALVHLQRGELAEAKLAVVRLLATSFDYEPDPVLDPPAYVALVTSVKEQLRVEAPPEVRPDTMGTAQPDSIAVAQPDTVATEPVFYTPPVPEPASAAFAFRRPRALYLGVLLGAGSYGGERGIDVAGSPLQEYVDNSGITLGLSVELALTERLAAALTYRAAHLPALLHDASAAPPIDAGRSSEWVHLLAAVGRARFGASWPASPYAQLGLGATVSRLDGATRTGIGPALGLGLDIALTPQLGAFAELSGLAVFPGDAVDALGDERFDLLTFLDLGLRYRLPVWR